MDNGLLAVLILGGLVIIYISVLVWRKKAKQKRTFTRSNGSGNSSSNTTYVDSGSGGWFSGGWFDGGSDSGGSDGGGGSSSD